MARSNRQSTKIVKELGKRGWVIRDGNHYMAYSPDTLFCYSIAKTPSDSHTMPNTWSKMKSQGENVLDLKNLFK